MTKLTGNNLSNRLNRFGAGKSMQAGSIKRGAGKVLSTLAVAGLLFAAAPGSAQAQSAGLQGYTKDKYASQAGYCIYNGSRAGKVIKSEANIIHEEFGSGIVSGLHFHTYDFNMGILTAGYKQGGSFAGIMWSESKSFSELDEAMKAKLEERRQWIKDCAAGKL